MTLYLLRHGETDWNRQHQLQGIRDVPLNRAGIRQSRELARRFSAVRIAAIFTSPLARARDTAIAINRRMDSRLVIEDRLREIDHGHWTGMTTAEIAAGCPSQYVAWRANPGSVRPRTGEAIERVYRRATNVLSALLGNFDAQNVLLVTHGVVNALLLCALFQIPIDRVWELPQPNGAIYRVRFHRRETHSVEYLDHV